MAPTFITAIAMLVAGFLANHGIVVSSDNLAVTLQTIVLIGGPIVVMFRQVITGRSTWIGTRPEA